MLRKILILAGALIVASGATMGALYYFYPVRVSVFAGLTRNFFLSWSAPPGTVSTESNPAGQSAAAVVPAPAAQAPPPEPSGADWPGYNRTLTSDRFSPLRQINTENVGKLKVLCTYDVGQFAAFELEQLRCLLALGLMQHMAHAVGEERGERKLAAGVGRDARILLACRAHDERILDRRHGPGADRLP